MTIRIIKEEPIYLTQTEHERLRREWDAVCSYNTSPPTFEEYVRRHHKNNTESHKRNVELLTGLVNQE